MTIGAMIRYYFHIDPDTLSEDEIARAWGQLKYVLKQTGQYE